MASALYHKYGIRKGDRVALMLKNGFEFAITIFAVAKIGAISVPLNTAYKGEELVFQLSDSGAIMLVTELDFQELIVEIRSEIKDVKHIFVSGGEPADGMLSFSELIEGEKYGPVGVKVDETDGITILYTSGTTGRPKGALLSYKGVIASAMNMTHVCDWLSGRDKILDVAPLFHSTGLILILVASIYAGIPVVIMKRFRTADTLEAIDEERITTMTGVPTIFWLMLNLPEYDQYDLSSLRMVAIGGSAASEELLKLWAEKLPTVPLLAGYGLTEASAMTHTITTAEEAERWVGSVGIVMPTLEAKVVDASGKELPPGGVGELLLTGSQLFIGYWNNPKATKETIVDGWLHTGDVAKMTEEGQTYILDRIKDMIDRGGENIYSIEVENVIYRHPKVLEVAVVGVPDPIFVEQVKAVIVLKPGEQATPEEIQEFCGKYLARYKIPKYVEFREALPRNPAGKVIKGALK
jgi:long-chain acyl-CoA synthetase